MKVSIHALGVSQCMSVYVSVGSESLLQYVIIGFGSSKQWMTSKALDIMCTTATLIAIITFIFLHFYIRLILLLDL